VEATRRKPRSTRVRWLLSVLAVAALGTCSLVEPMRWRLPLRFLFDPLDIHRTGSIDYTMCMRAALTPEEADKFVRAMFEPDERAVRPVPMHQTMCPASFWPDTFTANTTAYTVDYWPNGLVEGSSGAVYQKGYLYFWSNMA
jgi:hypothetical protein